MKETYGAIKGTNSFVLAECLIFRTVFTMSGYIHKELALLYQQGYKYYMYLLLICFQFYAKETTEFFFCV